MATNHISGYTGAIAFGGGSSDVKFDPDVAAGGTDYALESWEVTQEQGNFEAYAKAQEWVTTFPTVARWRATASFLLQSGVTAESLEIRNATSVSKAVSVIFTPVTGDTLSGAGSLDSLAFSSEKEGPAMVTVGMIGTGALVAAVTP